MCDFGVSRISNLCFKIVLKTVFTKQNTEAPLPGYQRFLNGHREKIQAENQDLPFHKVTKILGNMVSRPTSLQKQVGVVTCWSACFVIDMTIGYPGLSNVSEILIYL